MVNDYRERLHRVIPGGAHTYSRNQFPVNAPPILRNAHGAWVFDMDGKKYLDYGMGLRSVTCGYAEPTIANAAADGILMGNCLSRPSWLELQAAELLCSIVQSDMVKFTKTGSAATTAAVKLARAATGRLHVACAGAPFYSYDDWFIGTTSRNRGIPLELRPIVHIFGDRAELDRICGVYPVACIITEPYGDLQAIRDICDKRGIVLIFDEMITGFRYRLGSKTDVRPDLACWGKAIANGFSVAAVTGRRDIMEHGAKDDMFFMSTTHGAEMCGLGAFMETMKFMMHNRVAEHCNEYGEKFCALLKRCGLVYELSNPAIGGDAVNPSLTFDTAYNRTLFLQELAKSGVLMPWVSFSYAHKERELEFTERAVMQALDAITKGAVLEGPVIDPVFT